MIESILCGSTDPDMMRRPSVARIMRESPPLRARIESARTQLDGRNAFLPESARVITVMLKLARGHAAFELSQPCRSDPDHFWCGPLESLPQDQRDAFESVHIQQIFGEVGSRNLQRMVVTQFMIESATGEPRGTGMLVNDWVDVQNGRYRYLAIDDVGGLVIRIVVSEYLACEVAWKLNTQ